MHTFTARLLLLIYLNASAQLLLPFAADCIAHLFFHEHHLAHAHQGAPERDHLTQELADACGANDQESDVAVTFGADKLQVHEAPMIATDPGSVGVVVLPCLPDVRKTGHKNPGLALRYPPPEMA